MGLTGLSLSRLITAVKASRVDLGRNAFLLSAEFAQERAAVAEGGGGGGGSESKEDTAGERAKTDEEVALERADEAAALEARAAAAAAAALAARRARKQCDLALRAAADRLVELQKLLAAREAELALQSRALDLALGDAPAATAALEADVSKRVERLQSLSEEWEAHRAPLVASVLELKGRAARAEAKSAEAEEATAVLRREMRGLVEAVKAKEAEAKALQQRETALPKDVPSRAQYVGRIVNIVTQAKKQEAQEVSISMDIERVQTETARLTDTLGRLTKATEETVYAEVKAKRSSKPHVAAFAAFTGLREAFTQLLGSLQDTATADAEKRDIQRRCDQLRQRSAAQNRDDVLRDLAQVRPLPLLLQLLGVLLTQVHAACARVLCAREGVCGTVE
jgi:hypothetical protein